MDFFRVVNGDGRGLGGLWRGREGGAADDCVLCADTVKCLAGHVHEYAGA